MAEEIVLDFKQVRLLLLYKFREHSSASDIAKNTCNAIGPSIVSYDPAKVWFLKFKNGDSAFDDKPSPGRPVELDDEHLLELNEDDPLRDTRGLAEELQRHQNPLAVHLRLLGKTCKYDSWIPHDLNGCQLQVQKDACMNLLTFRRTFAWLANLVVDDETKSLYVNHTRKRQWLGRCELEIPNPGRSSCSEGNAQCFMELQRNYSLGGAANKLYIHAGVYCRTFNCVAAALL